VRVNCSRSILELQALVEFVEMLLHCVHVRRHRLSGGLTHHNTVQERQCAGDGLRIHSLAQNLKFEIFTTIPVKPAAVSGPPLRVPSGLI
jgi:hypothetical protein